MFMLLTGTTANVDGEEERVGRRREGRKGREGGREREREGVVSHV